MRRLTLTLLVAALAAVPGVAAAGGGGHGGESCDGFGTEQSLVMVDNCFQPVAFFATAGTPVLVENWGELPHTLTDVGGGFDTGWIDPGDQAELVVDDPGVYRVWCTLHGTTDGYGMTGVLVVGEPPLETLSLEVDAFQGIVDGLTSQYTSGMDGLRADLTEFRRSLSMDRDDLERTLAATLENGTPAPVEPVVVEAAAPVAAPAAERIEVVVAGSEPSPAEPEGADWSMALGGAGVALAAVAMLGVFGLRRGRASRE